MDDIFLDCVEEYLFYGDSSSEEEGGVRDRDRTTGRTTHQASEELSSGSEARDENAVLGRLGVGGKVPDLLAGAPGGELHRSSSLEKLVAIPRAVAIPPTRDLGGEEDVDGEGESLGGGLGLDEGGLGLDEGPDVDDIFVDCVEDVFHRTLPTDDTRLDQQLVRRPAKERQTNPNICGMLFYPDDAAPHNTNQRPGSTARPDSRRAGSRMTRPGSTSFDSRGRASIAQQQLQRPPSPRPPENPFQKAETGYFVSEEGAGPGYFVAEEGLGGPPYGGTELASIEGSSGGSLFWDQQQLEERRRPTGRGDQQQLEEQRRPTGRGVEGRK